MGFGEKNGGVKIVLCVKVLPSLSRNEGQRENGIRVAMGYEQTQMFRCSREIQST